jgi:GAF domain-containing protein
MSDANLYRERAAETQRLADAAESDSVRETLQDIARKYLNLAANEERAALVPHQTADGLRDVSYQRRDPAGSDGRAGPR